MAEPIATVDPSPGRRVFGVGVLGLLGVLLFYLAAGPSHSSGMAQLALFLAGAASMAAAVFMWSATGRQLILTEEGLQDDTGRLLAPIEQIASIDRGMFAMKPSNGFILRLKARGSAVWVPGLWWRLGKRVGVGGVTAANQTKVMAEAITVLLIKSLDAD